MDKDEGRKKKGRKERAWERRGVESQCKNAVFMKNQPLTPKPTAATQLSLHLPSHRMERGGGRNKGKRRRKRKKKRERPSTAAVFLENK